MKILALDIETSPAEVYAWGLWDQNIGLNQVAKPTRMLCFAAKFVGETGAPLFFSEHHDGTEAMLRAAHELLDEADVVIHWNGTSFDIPHLNREFLEHGFRPPAPFHEIDLCRVVKRRFRFMSNKLQWVTEQLGLEGKVKHEGFDLWLKCLAGDDKAWARMRKYNRRDVTLLEDLYEQLLPWIPNHPNRRLTEPDAGCPRCGADESRLESRGYRYTAVSKFRRFCCRACGGWSSRTVKDAGTKTRSA